MLLDGACGLKGVGHFTIWFLLGFILFFLILFLSKRPIQSKVAIYGPFLPFVLGALATVPYVVQILGLVEKNTLLNPILNLWLLYPFFEQSSLVCKWFSNFHINLLILATSYTVLIIHYIRLIKSLRTNLGKSQNEL